MLLGEALERRGSGPSLPLGLVGQDVWPREAQPRVGGGGSFGLKCCGGGCLQPTVMPKG